MNRKTFLPLLLLACFSNLAAADSGQTNVTMLVPGFVVRELPVKLSNINNLRFTPGGKLSALGYDGRIHLLEDTDGDGLEDRATPFWDKSTLSVPVGMAWSSNGLYVSSKAKISLLRDTDGDGKADVEEIVATGWPATDVGSGGVDATAVTFDTEGNLYFGLLTADYSNPYRVKDGVPRYDLNGKRGTIQKWSPATKQLETVATGIRVPYTLAFNQAGDLFVTDQEGETWCPGGNPFDELNHIRMGRNYGFPPRHEHYLPDLISEPPVVNFAPQHQSTCGFVFNEAGAGGKTFGPASWKGNALVAGQSRGKIWRVQLVKTAAGYIGKETLIARLNMLTTDVALSPNGDLYVSCHSGPPDWGTGPKGEGKLFKISYPDGKIPQPVAIWPTGPMEVRVAFDQAIDAAVTNQIAEMGIEFGEYVSAADRLENLKPPYAVVKEQAAVPRGKLRVVGANLSSDRRTLHLRTDPHPQSVTYAITLPALKTDLSYTLNGLEARWINGAGDTKSNWTGWLPHADLQASREFTRGSREQEMVFERLQQKGELQLRTRLALPATNFWLHTVSDVPLSLTLGEASGPWIAGKGSYTIKLFVEERDAAGLLTIRLPTNGKSIPSLQLTWSTDLDPTERPLPLSAFRLPWAPAREVPPRVETTKSDLSGGDYERGRSLFFGQRLQCASCHRIRGEGKTAGPDLSNLIHKDAASVLRDIKEPDVMINPDYVAYNVATRDGEEISGFVRAQNAGAVRVMTVDGKEHVFAQSEVTDLRPATTSLMPSGLLDGLSDLQIRDLLTFLLHAAPERSAKEIEKVWQHTSSSVADKSASSKPLNIVLVASKQDHGRGQHDYPAWQKKWAPLLQSAERVTVSEAWEWPSPTQWEKADVIVLYFWNHNWSEERYRQLDAYQARGGGLVVLHSATIADKEPEKLVERIGLAAQPGPTKYLHAPVMLKFVAPTNHPISAGFKQLNLLDEPYWPMFGDTNRIGLLATADVEGQPRPLIWTFEKGKGRVFASIIGHYTWTLDDPLFQLLVFRGMAWTAGQPTDRLFKSPESGVSSPKSSSVESVRQ